MRDALAGRHNDFDADHLAGCLTRLRLVVLDHAEGFGRRPRLPGRLTKLVMFDVPALTPHSLGETVMKNVFVYVDDGSSFEDLLRELARELDHSVGRLIPLLAEDVVDGAVLTGVGTLVMPGGADLPYRAKLDGSGNARIRRFVEEGGTYLGVCAGAYYGCRSLAFHEGRNDEVSGSRELAFVDAQAVGSLPELGPLYDLTIRSASSARLEWEGQGTFRGYLMGDHASRWMAGPHTCSRVSWMSSARQLALNGLSELGRRY